MFYPVCISIGLLLGAAGGVAFALASPETRELFLGLPLWATVAAGLVGTLPVALAFVWHRRRPR